MNSDNLDKFLPAFALAKRAMGPALKNAVNPHFRNKYADLGSVMDAVDSPLLDNGIVYTQVPKGIDLHTRLTHAVSGQYIEGVMPICAKSSKAQDFGSGLTYARRYSLATMCGIAQEDDDGNAAQRRKKNKQQHPQYVDSAGGMVPPPMEPGPPPEENGPGDPQKVLFDEFVGSLSGAKTLAELNTAAALVKKIGFRGEYHSKLLGIYKECRAKFNG